MSLDVSRVTASATAQTNM